MNVVPSPELDIVMMNDCVLHESLDPQRVARIARRLETEDVLRNPPIVARYPTFEWLLVLDGATRLSALNQLGYRTAVVQIVDYASDAIELQTWAHLLPDTRATDLIGRFRAIAGVEVKPATRAEAHMALHRRELLCYVLCPSGQTWTVEGGTSLSEMAQLLDTLFTSYTGPGTVERVAADEGFHSSEPPNGHVAVLFPRYTKAELVELAAAGLVLPGGITRHLIPGRVLHLDLPLAVLRNDDVEAQRTGLHRWVEHRHARGTVRLYTEATWIFDE